jgi:cytochrome c biogenesis protein ResB
MIPAERQQELIVLIENPNVSALISPPVIDGAIVVGHPLRPDGRTVYFVGHDPINNTLLLRTENGLTFTVNNAVDTTPAETYASQTKITIGDDDPDYTPAEGVDAIHYDMHDMTVWEWVE